MREVVSNDCPLCSIQPRPASLVHPFSPPGYQYFHGGLEDDDVGNPAVAAAAASSCSCSRTVSDKSWIGWERSDMSRHIILAADVRRGVWMTFGMMRARYRRQG